MGDTSGGDGPQARVPRERRLGAGPRISPRKRILKDIPPLRFGEGRDCTLPACVAAATAQEYDWVMGASGAAFTTTIDVEAWDPLAAAPLDDDTLARAARSTGTRPDALTPPYDADMRDLVIDRMLESLETKVPPLARGLIGPAEYGLVVGCDDDGPVFYARTYFDKSEQPSKLEWSAIESAAELVFLDRAGAPDRATVARDAVDGAVAAGVASDTAMQTWIAALRDDTRWSDTRRQAARSRELPEDDARAVPHGARRGSAPRRGVLRLRRGRGEEGGHRSVRRVGRDALPGRGPSALVGEAARSRARTRARRARGAGVRARGHAVNDLAAAAILGLVQGLTEFLPVSSTAHLILVSDALGLDPLKFGLSFDVALHLGTALAVLLYFARTWIDLARDVLALRLRWPALVIVGTIPAALAGVAFQSQIESGLRDPAYVAAFLIIGSILFVLAERFTIANRAYGSIGFIDAFVMGVAQAIALLPGISRSGITISAGLYQGIRRGDATRFSFLLATPVIVGAGAKTLLDARKAADLFAAPDVLAVGFGLSFLSGLAAVAFMVRFLRVHSLNWFVVYRLALAAIVIAVLVMAR
jgi:undecaprenyl-diphosphatase